MPNVNKPLGNDPRPSTYIWDSNTTLNNMRTLLSLVAVVAFMASATAQDVSTEKKARKGAKTEAVSTTEAAPKAACCASKAAAASCASKAGKAEASATPASDGTTATGEGLAADGEAKKAGCCAGMSEAEKKACCAGKSTAEKAGCAGKAEAHNHDHSGEEKVEDAPEAQPNH